MALRDGPFAQELLLDCGLCVPSCPLWLIQNIPTLKPQRAQRFTESFLICIRSPCTSVSSVVKTEHPAIETTVSTEIHREFSHLHPFSVYLRVLCGYFLVLCS